MKTFIILAIGLMTASSFASDCIKDATTKFKKDLIADKAISAVKLGNGFLAPKGSLSVSGKEAVYVIPAAYHIESELEDADYSGILLFRESDCSFVDNIGGTLNP